MEGVCPKCGGELTSSGCCANFRNCDYTVSNSFDLYDLSGSVKGELNNNLVLVNETIKAENLNYVPVFYILGGAAMIFHSLNYKMTLDIDMANKMEDNIKQLVGQFISDNASEVVVLGGNYKERAVRYRPEFTAIEVYILAKEDLLITKLIGMKERRKDVRDIVHSGLLDRHIVSKAESVLATEYDERVCNALRADLRMLVRSEQEGC